MCIKDTLDDKMTKYVANYFLKNETKRSQFYAQYLQCLFYSKKIELIVKF